MTQLKSWFVYIIRTRKGALYTGITTDVERRFLEHVKGRRGARYFRTDRPEEVVYRCAFADRSSASREESRVKKLSRAAKQALIAQSGTN